MKLTTLGKSKFDKIAQQINERAIAGQSIDIDFRADLIRSISDLFKNGGLPDISEFLNIKEIEGVTSKHLNDIQTFLYDSLREYQHYIQDVGSDLNVLLGELLSSNVDMNKKKKAVLSKILDIENAVINKNSAKAIHNEELITSDFKDDNNVSNNTTVEITDNGAIILPVYSESDVTISDISYKVEFPIEASKSLKIADLVNGIEESKIYKNGHYLGKLFGKLDERDDIRIGSNINSLLNNNIDRSWEVEFVTNNISNQKLRVSVMLTFVNKVNINALLIDSSNEIEAFYKDDKGEFVHIFDYNNEWFHDIVTDQIKLVVYGNNPEKTLYNLLSIIRNNVNTYTYNYIETLFRKRPDIYKNNFRHHDVKPDNRNEGSADVSDETILHRTKYRTSVMLNSINTHKREYQNSGVFETNEITIGNSIYSVELFSNSLTPTDTFEYIKYEISFDGKEFFPVRSLSDSVNSFNSAYHTRIVLGEEGTTPGYLYLPDKVYDTVYVRISMNTNDASITPALFQYKLRVKTKE